MLIYRLIRFVLCFVWFSSLTHAEQRVWSLDECQQVLDKTLEIKLAPDLGALGAGERQALDHLMAAGEILHDLYLIQRHPEAMQARASWERMRDPEHRDALHRIFWMSKGPIATTLDNRRVPFLDVAPEVAGKNLYPHVDKSEIDKACAADEEAQRRLLGERTVVRRLTDQNLSRDRAVLNEYTELAFLHPGYSASIKALKPGDGFYAVPYALAYPEKIMRVHRLLMRAAAAVRVEDPEFSAYLRHRARDLLVSDYEAGDASWVTGRFKNLNAQIGSYETYDDALFGVKAFQSMSLLVRDIQRSEELSKQIQDIQKIEDRLPYQHQRRVRSDIPVGVYNVVADFGQARGTNTATILPNDPEHTRKYGRTILLRYNVMTHPELFALSQQRFSAAVAPQFRDHLTMEGGFRRTLWHEIGHYLGVDRTADGQVLGESLRQYSDVFEEMKADLVSLHAAQVLHQEGVYSEEELRAIYAGGVLRVLQSNRPRPEQPYQTMQLIQWNHFLEKGVLEYDEAAQYFIIHYDAYPEAVESLLAEVLEIQRNGNLSAAAQFVNEHTQWNESLHEAIADKLRGAATYRFRLVKYAALGSKSPN